MCLILLKVEQSAFTQAFFSSLSDINKSFGGLQMAPSSFDKQRADCDSPHNWLMSLARDLVALCDFWRDNGTNGSHLAVFSQDVAFACHFVASLQPAHFHQIGVLVLLATPVKTIQNGEQFS